MADFFEGYASIRQHVLIRFGQMARDCRAGTAGRPRALLHHNVEDPLRQGRYHAALGEVTAAEAERVLFREAAKRVPKSRYLHNVSCGRLLAVAEEMLAGEIAHRRGEVRRSLHPSACCDRAGGRFTL